MSQQAQVPTTLLPPSQESKAEIHRLPPPPPPPEHRRLQLAGSQIFITGESDLDGEEWDESVDAATPTDLPKELPRPWVRPELEKDGSVSPANLQLAVTTAVDAMSAAERSAHWARMLRRMGSSDCPDIIKEEWSKAANDRFKKNEVFKLLLACGGNVGVVEAAERITKSKKDVLGW